MIISEIEFNVILPFIDGEPITRSMEADMMPAIDEKLQDFHAKLCEMVCEDDYLYFRFSSTPDHSAAGQVSAVVDCLTQLLVGRKEMEGYKQIFSGQAHISTGKKRDAEAVEVFLKICRDGF